MNVGYKIDTSTTVIEESDVWKMYDAKYGLIVPKVYTDAKQNVIRNPLTKDKI